MDLIFLTLFLLFPVAIVFFFRKFQLDLFQVNVSNFVFWNFFLSSYIGFFILYFQLDQYRVDAGVNSEILVLQTFLSAVLCISFIAIGLHFGRLVFGDKVANYRGVEATCWTNYLIIILLFVICFWVLKIYLSQLNSVALLSLFVDGGDVHMARSEMGNNFSGKYHWYRLFFRDIASLLLFIVLADFLVKKGLMKGLFLLVLFFFVSFSSLMATEKGPFAWNLVGLFLVVILLKRNRKINFRAAFIIALASFASLGAMYMLFMGSADIFGGIAGAISRVTAGAIQPAYHYFEYADDIGMLYGQSFPNPKGILPFSPYPLTKEVWAMTFPGQASLGLVGSMPTAFWAEIYLNFSYLGIAIVSIIVGFALKMVDALLSIAKPNPCLLGFEVWALLHYKDLSTTGVGAFVVDTPLVAILFIMVVLTLFNVKRSRTNNVKGVLT